MRQDSIVITVIILVWILCIFIPGCSPTSDSKNSSSLPIGAIIERDLGNGWLIFEIQGADHPIQCIYHSYTLGIYQTRECVSCWEIRNDSP